MLPGSATAWAPDTESRCPALPPDYPVPCLWAADSIGEGICQGSTLSCKLPGAGEPNTKAQRPLIPWQAKRGARPETRWLQRPLACLPCPCHTGGLPASHTQAPKVQDLCQPVSREEPRCPPLPPPNKEDGRGTARAPGRRCQDKVFTGLILCKPTAPSSRYRLLHHPPPSPIYR